MNTPFFTLPLQRPSARPTRARAPRLVLGALLVGGLALTPTASCVLAADRVSAPDTTFEVEAIVGHAERAATSLGMPEPIRKRAVHRLEKALSEPETSPKTFRLAGSKRVAAVFAYRLGEEGLLTTEPSGRILYRTLDGEERLRRIDAEDVDCALAPFPEWGVGVLFAGDPSASLVGRFESSDVLGERNTPLGLAIVHYQHKRKDAVLLFVSGHAASTLASEEATLRVRRLPRKERRALARSEATNQPEREK